MVIMYFIFTPHNAQRNYANKRLVSFGEGGKERKEKIEIENIEKEQGKIK